MGTYYLRWHGLLVTVAEKLRNYRSDNLPIRMSEVLVMIIKRKYFLLPTEPPYEQVLDIFSVRTTFVH